MAIIRRDRKSVNKSPTCVTKNYLEIDVSKVDDGSDYSDSDSFDINKCLLLKCYLKRLAIRNEHLPFFVV